MLDHITPVILTFNEEANIDRTLSALRWAKRIVVVDSGSTDSTLAILAKNPRIAVFSRRFDTHGQQWKFAINETGIRTGWVLRLDADYFVTPVLIDEIAQLDPAAPVSAYKIAFDFAVCGTPLRASLYPANTVLFRAGQAAPLDRGHSEVWTIEGPVAELKERMLHDDRKPVPDWIIAQGRYVTREYSYLRATAQLRFPDAIRLRPPLMPLLSFLYCYFIKGLFLDGRAGLFYCLQRLLVETAVSLIVLEGDLKQKNKLSTPRSD
jgi:glycosyltransferase involved in cell wall biosynthesis